MKKHLSELASKLDYDITLHESEVNDQLEKAKKCMSIALDAYQQMQEIYIQNQWNCIDEEIYYFKVVKPIFTKHLFYYNKLYKLYTKQQTSTVKSYMKYLKRELHKLDAFLEQHDHLINLYKNKQTQFDIYYFTRKHLDTNLLSGTTLISQKLNHLTNGDLVIAKYLAYDKLHNILHSELYAAKNGYFNQGQPFIKSNFRWTASKSDLVEILYALVAARAINNGDVEIKQLVQFFESIFNISLGDPYRLFNALRKRKKTPTHFLETITSHFETYIELSDRKYD